jgi:hypothetical protein
VSLHTSSSCRSVNISEYQFKCVIGHIGNPRPAEFSERHVYNALAKRFCTTHQCPNFLAGECRQAWLAQCPMLCRETCRSSQATPCVYCRHADVCSLPRLVCSICHSNSLFSLASITILLSYNVYVLIDEVSQ